MGIKLPEFSLSELFDELEKTSEKIENIKIEIKKLSPNIDSLDKINDNAKDEYNFQLVKYGMENLNQIFFLKAFVLKIESKSLKKQLKIKAGPIKYVILLMMIILLPY